MANKLQKGLGIEFLQAQRQQQDQLELHKDGVIAGMMRYINREMYRASILVPPHTNVIEYDGDSMLIYNERLDHSTTFDLGVENDLYSITPRPGLSVNGRKTHMDATELSFVTGETDDLSDFIGAIEYILAIHFPTAAEDGRLKTIMDNYRDQNNIPKAETRPSYNAPEIQRNM